MTNFEKYKNEILAFVHKNVSTPAVVNGEFAKCSVTDCDKCELKGFNCRVELIEWLYEDDGEVGIDTRGCSSCKYANKAIHGFPCSKCRRNYNDKFKPEPKKTRQDEFLERYPNAKVHRIQPCSIEDKNFISGRCDRYDDCSDCTDVYWKQEVK